MRIGIVGPIWLNIPPEKYGGTEEVVYNLTNGLTEKGHEVTLFGPETAKVKAKLFPTVKMPLREQDIEWTNVAYNLYHLTEAFDHAGEFDILHVHLNKSQDYMALPLALHSKTPVLFTLHFKLPSPSDKLDRYLVLDKYRNFPFTSISNSQRGHFPLNFIATIYNSINVAAFPFQQTPQDYFIWLGKVNPLKGTKEAILAAKQAGVKLYVLGVVDSGVPHMLTYYEEEVKPLFDGKQIIWMGEVGMEEKAKLLGGAKAFLNPIQWEEPFGLVMAEAQVTGTPVISFERGAAPELIIDGKTGFLVKSIHEMVEKIKLVDRLDRKACRENIEHKFSVPTMIEGYEHAYTLVQQNWQTYLDRQMQELLKNSLNKHD